MRYPRAFLTCLLAALLLALIPSAAFAQSQDLADLREEIQQLRTQMKVIEDDLQQIKATLREQATRNAPVFDIAGAPSKGNADSKLVLIEFSDFECPYCLEYFKTIYSQILGQYVKTGKLRYVFIDFPGEKTHPDALRAAEASHCADEQSKFWEMHDELFSRQRDLAGSGISDAARAVGLDVPAFHACLSSEKYAGKVHEAEQATAKLGLKGTPAFVFGTVDPQNPMKVKLERALVGAQPYAMFQQTIDGLLAQR